MLIWGINGKFSWSTHPGTHILASARDSKKNANLTLKQKIVLRIFKSDSLTFNLFLLQCDFCNASNYILSIKRHVLANCATEFFFSITETKRSRFFSIKDFSFFIFVSPSKITKDFKCIFGEVCVIPDTER